MSTPIIVKREKIINKPAAILWELIEPAENISSWLPMAGRSELISGQGKGRIQKMYSTWGNKAVQIEQEVVAYEPMRLIRWKHINELFNGKKASPISAETYFTIVLLPNEGNTTVMLQSENYPASFIKGLFIRLIAKPRLEMAIKKSLEILSG